MGQKLRLILATRNEHKVRELAELLGPHEIVPLPSEVVAPAGDRRRPSPPTR